MIVLNVGRGFCVKGCRLDWYLQIHVQLWMNYVVHVINKTVLPHVCFIKFEHGC